MKKLLYILLLLPVLVNAQVIVTVAGTGEYAYGGDGGPATNAKLRSPLGVAVDDTGNLYICDNTCIRKVKPGFGGIISTIAGISITGYSGDGGPATNARVSGVLDMAVDRYGNLFLADSGNDRIRKVTTDGIIRTIAGTGVPGYNGDGIPATDAQLNSPQGITVDDAGNIYIADSYNYRIRKINTAGIISTIAGTGIAGHNGNGRADTTQINGCYCPRIDKHGNVFFIDSMRVRKLDAMGMISTVAGNGLAGYSGDGGSATLASIQAVAIFIDSSDNLLIADGGNGRLRAIGTEGTIYTIAGSGFLGFGGDWGDPLLAKISYAGGVAVAKNGDIFIGDAANNRVRMITKLPIGVANVVPRENENLEVYPNPACNQLTIKITEEIKSVSIVNMLGVAYDLPPAVPYGDRKTGVTVLDISMLPTGGYIVRVNGVYVQLFMKE